MTVETTIQESVTWTTSERVTVKKEKEEEQPIVGDREEAVIGKTVDDAEQGEASNMNQPQQQQRSKKKKNLSARLQPSAKPSN